MTQHKITREVPWTRPSIALTSFTGGAGGAPSGQVPTSIGSNGQVAWGSNVALITVNGTTLVQGPFVNFANGSNTTVTVDQVGSVASNTIRIHATGGAASFGSNSNQVSYANAPGASTDSSRADHVHLGVTSVSHASNTYSGPVILAPGANVGITSPTPGTFAIHSSASGGSGSGGGAPTTAEYLVTAADATLSAERVVDLGAYSLLTRRAASNTEDDHFNAGTLDAKWLAYTSHNASTDLTVISGWAKLTAGGAKLQAVPVGDWTIEVEVLGADYLAGAFGGDGLILTNGTTATSATDARWGIGGDNTLGKWRFVFEKFVNNAFSSTYATTTGLYLPNHFFLRINKSGTTYRVDWAVSDKTWITYTSTGSLGFTPTHFGFRGNSGAFFNYFLRY
jgi:hypothetical protein